MEHERLTCGLTMGNCCSPMATHSGETKEKIPMSDVRRAGERNLCQSFKNKTISPSFLRTGQVLTPTSEDSMLSKSTEKEKLPFNPTQCPHGLLREPADPWKDHNRMDFDDSKIASLFVEYKDQDDEIIEISGVEKLCHDLALEPTDFKILLLAWKFSASEMCKFTKEEFFEGCRRLKADSVLSIRERLSEIEQLVTIDADAFRDLYRFTYNFGLDSQEGQRTLPVSVALELWHIVFSRVMPVFMKDWESFLRDHHVKGISKDTWNMFLYLVENINPDFSNYDDSEAWPSLFDEFVEYKGSKSDV